MTRSSIPPSRGPDPLPSRSGARTPPEGVRRRALEDAYAKSPRLMALCDYLFKHDVRVLAAALAVALVTGALASRLEAVLMNEEAEWPFHDLVFEQIRMVDCFPTARPVHGDDPPIPAM